MVVQRLCMFKFFDIILGLLTNLNLYKAILMLKPKIIESVAENFKGLVPTDLLTDAIKATLKKMDVISREEFDIQTKVLAKTRAKLEALEEKVLQLERTNTIENGFSNSKHCSKESY